MNWLIKMLCPSAATLAGYAAEGIARSVNGTEADVKAMVAKYAAYAEKATAVANRLAKMVEDGSIDEAETVELAGIVEPLFDTALGYALEG